MNILVLGGNGYLGSKILKQLVLRNSNVFSTIREYSDLSRLNDIKDNINFVNAKYQDIDNMLSDVRIDCIVNMVCDYGRRANIDMIYSNLMFPLEVLELAAKHKVNKFITVGHVLPVNQQIPKISLAVDFSRAIV